MKASTQTQSRPGARVGHAASTVRRDDAIPKVTGEFAYSSDLDAPGMLWGRTVRSPHPHARIVSIDIGPALALPGVHAVLTHADVPGAKTYGLEFADQPVLAIDRVRYHGEPVALVAADHPEQARRAAEAIVVEYEPLPVVSDMEQATESAPIHDGRPTAGHGYRDDDRPNVLRSIEITHGDPATTGDVVVSGVYEVGTQDQAFLGPESGLAIPDAEGGVDIYVATQWLHVDRDQIAPCLALAAGARARAPRRGGWRLRWAGRPLDADPRGDARASHGPADQDRLRPLGVVRRSCPSAPGEDLDGASRRLATGGSRASTRAF